jgi:transposase InsO family protein
VEHVHYTRGFAPVTRTAEHPGQTVNVDLCFVPATHIPSDAKLPAVSGSSGRLVVERLGSARSERAYPGQIFAASQPSYAEAMHAFVAASSATPTPLSDGDATPGDVREATAAKIALRRQASALRDQRRTLRQQRCQEDAAWRLLRQQRHAAAMTVASPARRGESAREAQQVSVLHWRLLRLQRRLLLQRRQREDALWRSARQRLRDQVAQTPRVSAWIAILVITDNCTRQCLGLPLFVVGAKVTADLLVEALRTLLPAELQFLITDRGTHFTAQVFAQFAHQADFLHVLIARHRPQSNGIAERFVRTLKEWLADKTWETAAELESLLYRMRVEYNDRPHQGLGIPGLSPNAFAERIWLM